MPGGTGGDPINAVLPTDSPPTPTPTRPHERESAAPHGRSGRHRPTSRAGAAHVPVLLDRVLALLGPALADRPAVAVDATLGLGGHAEALLRRTRS